MKKGMSISTYKKIGFVIAFVILDLLGLISWITGYDYLSDDRCFIILIIAIITGSICVLYLDKRIESQETEELAEDLEYDIGRISSIALIVAIILFFIIGLVYVYC
ncbi:MAG: hypothetical protein HDR36_06195 [Treponema sp.]|nr:hypothetical protein [Treponema sp.]